MANVTPLSREALAELEPVFQMVEHTMGFVPNSLLTLAHRPEILRALAMLAGGTLSAGVIEGDLKQLVAYVASTAAGCRYCQAHTAEGATRRGVAREKIAAVWEFEWSPLFDERERAALRLARDASIVPNATTPAHFEALRRYFRDDQIVELVAVVSLFGWLNRWNDTMATELEAVPLAFAAELLSRGGWRRGKHG